MDQSAIINKIVDILKYLDNILFITGAGISADSGLPTYRGIGGLYHENMTQDGIPIEEALSGDMMSRKPKITWKYIQQIESSSRKARFNSAHKIISDLEKKFKRVWVLTQNVDGFHKDAGSKNIIDIHGDIHNLNCTNCSYSETVKDYSNLQIPPHCVECNGMLRPGIVLFGELLPLEKLAILERELMKNFDIIFSIGTTSIFPYISSPVAQAVHRGIPTVEINPGRTEISDIVDYRLEMKAKDALQKINKRLSK